MLTSLHAYTLAYSELCERNSEPNKQASWLFAGCGLLFAGQSGKMLPASPQRSSHFAARRCHLARLHDLRGDLYPTPVDVARRRLLGPLKGPVRAVARWWHWLGTDTKSYHEPRFSHEEAWGTLVVGAFAFAFGLLIMFCIAAVMAWLYLQGMLWVPLGILAFIVVGASLMRKIIG